MNKKWIIPVAIATGMSLVGCQAENVEKSVVTEQVMKVEAQNEYENMGPISVEVMTEELSEDGVYEWKITTPRFNGYDFITQKIAKDISSVAGEYEFIKTIEEGEERLSPFYFSVSPNIFTNDKGVFSLSLDLGDYTGGAHGNYWSYLYNYDLVEQKEIALGDLFKSDSDYQEVLYQYLFDKMKDTPIFAENLKTYFYDKNEELQFYLESGKIHIYFGVYSIGSYADGAQVYVIPMDAIKDIVSDYGLNILKAE